MTNSARLSRLANSYLHAKYHVIRQGFEEEIEWQESRSQDRITETDFLRESAWVVLSSGMRESVVRRCFCGVTEAFLDWKCARQVASRRNQCVTAALRHFNHAKKIAAIADISAYTDRVGFARVHERLRTAGVSYLQELPYIGPVTAYHLAKNLGLDVVKPDRHLVRVAEVSGYASPEILCQALAELVGDKVAVIDIVIWRYATLDHDYLSHFRVTD